MHIEDSAESQWHRKIYYILRYFRTNEGFYFRFNTVIYIILKISNDQFIGLCITLDGMNECQLE